VLLPTSSRAFEELKEGRIDVIFAASKTSARADFAYFSDAYRDEVVRLYKYTESPDLNNISDFFYKDLTVAVIMALRLSCLNKTTPLTLL